jgi:hypothetical protein
VSDGDYHVLPVGDLVPHREHEDCACGPRIEVQPNGVAVIVHNSWDGRELEERA